MLIDWFTVGAQALNFLILVWLLKHFLYKPILNAINSREKRIAAELADAAALKAEAKRESDEFHSRNQAFDAERSALLRKATDEAEAARQQLLADARREAEALRVQQNSAMRDDQVKLCHEITRLAAQEVLGVARKTLQDLAAVDLEERIGEVFTRRLRDIDRKTKDSLAAALEGSAEPAIVRSTFAMSATERATVQKALNETFSADLPLRFETAAATISGIELTVGGQKLAWNIADYLAQLQQKLDSLLQTPAVPAPQIAQR
jgi:F-type H+-transporting ATPase subunit b